MQISILAAWLALVVTVNCGKPPPRVAPSDEELEPSFWFNKAQLELEDALANKPNTKVARNVIIFLGDGMSLTTVAAGRIWKGQLNGKTGEDEKLSFEKFPNFGWSKTYSYDAQISDSAVTATAVFCGTKSTYGTVGVNPKVKRGDCKASLTNSQKCIAHQAMDNGKVAGLITTARVTHATPANVYAFAAERYWENDAKLSDQAREEGCQDIGAQLMNEPAKDFKVIMAGGRQNVMPETATDPEYPELTGHRIDGRNIIDEWIAEKDGRGNAQFVWNREQFDAVDPAVTDYLMGLFEPDNMQYEVERDAAAEPSLADLVEKGIRILDKNENGFFLQVEGARIDHAHHQNKAHKSLGDMISFEEAVQRAYDVTDPEETLIVVTADHAHVLTMTSYARRGNPILGLTDWSTDVTKNGLSEVDGLPYTTLQYTNGPGYTPREDLTNVDIWDNDYMQRAAVPLNKATHDGTDVGIFASGPWSHLWHHVHEEHYTFHAASYAACLDGHCKK